MLAAHGGREVKHTGDGITDSIVAAASAVQASLAIQRELAGGDLCLRVVRVGLNAGGVTSVTGHDLEACQEAAGMRQHRQAQRRVPAKYPSCRTPCAAWRKDAYHREIEGIHRGDRR